MKRTQELIKSPFSYVLFDYCSFLLLLIRSTVPNTLMERIETAIKITAYGGSLFNQS